MNTRGPGTVTCRQAALRTAEPRRVSRGKGDEEQRRRGGSASSRRALACEERSGPEMALCFLAREAVGSAEDDDVCFPDRTVIDSGDEVVEQQGVRPRQMPGCHCRTI